MRRAVLLMTGAAAALSGCAQQPQAMAVASPRSDCFHAKSVSGFTPRGDEVVDIKVGANRHYRLQLMGHCPNVNWTTGVALVARGGSFICSGLEAELIVPNPEIGPQRCLVDSIRRLSDAEVQALRRQ